MRSSRLWALSSADAMLSRGVRCKTSGADGGGDGRWLRPSENWVRSLEALLAEGQRAQLSVALAQGQVRGSSRMGALVWIGARPDAARTAPSSITPRTHSREVRRRR